MKKEIKLRKGNRQNIDKIEKKRNSTDPSKNKKNTTKKIRIVLIFSILITIAIILLVLKWIYENNHTESISKKLHEEIPILHVDGENVELVNPPDASAQNDYWDFIKMPLISVDFAELLKRNPNTVGWIHVNNTNINYPVVQTQNNDDYLHKAFDGSPNQAGWIFADYRNDMKNFDKNTIIYGHSRLNKTMFGSLFQVLNQSWYQDKYNQVILFSTPTENTMWQVFSTYKIDLETYYLQTNFSNDASYETFLNTLKERSKYPFNVNLDASDKIITLSTCSDAAGTGRIVLHAKLIKRESR